MPRCACTHASRRVVSATAGPLYVSGRIAGPVTLRVNGRVVVVDRLTYANNPNTPDGAPCDDRLGLIATGDILVVSGLTSRARVVYASKDRVTDTAITYEELADPKWKGKVCSRSGQHTYNIALVASMIAHHGAEKAEAWLKGLKENLARKPAGGDRDQVKAIFAGECDLAIGNTYYMGLMTTNEKEPEQKEWAAAVKVLFPNAADRGTHVNLSGAALMKSAPDKESGLALIAFLSSAEAQGEYAALNHEYPVKEGVAPSELVQSWGELKADPIALEDIAKLRRQASELVDKVGFDNGPGT